MGREGVTPPGVDNPMLFWVRGVAMALPERAEWMKAVQEPMKAPAGVLAT